MRSNYELVSGSASPVCDYLRPGGMRLAVLTRVGEVLERGDAGALAGHGQRARRAQRGAALGAAGAQPRQHARAAAAQPRAPHVLGCLRTAPYNPLL